MATISLASLLFVGCDDSTTTGSDGNSGGSTTGDTESSGSNTDPTGNPTAGSDSNSDGTTTSDSGDTDSAGGSSSSGDPTEGTTGGSTGPDTGNDESGDGSSTTGGDASSSGGEETGMASDSDSDSDSAGEGKIDICEAPGDLTPCDDYVGFAGDATAVMNAMGLGCEGGPNEVIPVFNPIFQSNDATSWRIITQYGTHIDDMDGLPTWRPREGDSMLILSTGQLPAPDVDGVLVEATFDGDVSTNPDNSQLPAPMSPLPGSAGGAGGTPFVNCDLVNDCSDSLIDQWNLGGGDANDLLWFQFETVVPGGTYGFSFDFAYFSEEFPTYVDTSFNDMFLAWSNSESYTGNLCFVNDEPCTVTALANPDDYPEYHGSDPVMEGTQFDFNGGATGWFQANGTAVPGELLQLTFAVFDMGDQILDTSVLLDNFRWDCEGCTPSEVDPCIGIDPV
ncbi:MAG: choice-of-anchor L domain-containing protein [Nannocystaceae bacterium]|nr:choice-of-anchor L domain-containing protein [bacterium]